jgi:DNA-binding IclR family transcriptional regulator
VTVPVPASRFTGREEELGRHLLAARRRIERRLAD